MINLELRAFDALVRTDLPLSVRKHLVYFIQVLLWEEMLLIEELASFELLHAPLMRQQVAVIFDNFITKNPLLIEKLCIEFLALCTTSEDKTFFFVLNLIAGDIIRKYIRSSNILDSVIYVISRGVLT
jgi:hypothetical protein